MSSSCYTCKRCLYKTSHFNDIKRHLAKTKKCSKVLNAYYQSDDQLLIMSLLSEDIKPDSLEQYKDSNILYTNIIELVSVIDSIDKHKLKKCIYCNNEFSKICDLRQHVLLSCFYNKKMKEIQNTEKLVSIDGTNNANHSHNNNNTTTNNNINIYLEIKTPVPFDEQWDISNINKHTQTDLIFSKSMFTNLLSEILQNEINLNVIIDDAESVSGIVYKNDIEKYIQMKSKDIVNNTMDKLKHQLIDFNKKNTESLPEVVDISSKTITQKYNNYKNDENIQNSVDKLIFNLFKNKKVESVNIAKKISDNTEILEKAGY